MGKRNGWFAKNPKGGQSGGSGGSKWPGNNNWKTAGSGQALGGGGEPEANRDSDVPYGYERVKEGGDGDCLFHALARQALGDTNLALQARRDVCEWMERQLPAMTSSSSSSSSSESELSAAHRELIRQQREELTKGSSEEVHRYVKKMRCRGEWGTGLEALAAAYVYKRPVQVWSPDGFSELRSPATASFPSTAKPSDEADTSPPAGAAAPAAVAKPIRSSEPIRLIHNGRNHWDSLAVRASDAAPARGPSSKAKTQAEKAEEDLAFAVSLSLVESFPSVAPDERTERRKAAALAAEARLQKLQSRGLGKTTEKEQAMVPAEALAGQGKEDMSGAKGAAGVPAAVPASSASAAAAAAAASSASAVSAAAPPSNGSGPWDRRRAARLALQATAAAAAARKQAETANNTTNGNGEGSQIASAPDTGDTAGEDALAGIQDQDLAYALLLDGDRQSDAAVAELEACLAALEEAGLAPPEAQEALLRCGADVKKVKELYCIDWDEKGQVVHSPFQPPQR